MKSNKPSRLVPKLRFPEFRDEPGWGIGALGDIATFTSGGTPSKDVPEYWNGHIPWISASSMYDTNICDSERKVTALAIGNGTRIAKAGSLLVLTRGSMLYNRVPMGIASIDVAFNQDVRALSIDTAVDTFFLMRQLIAQESRIPINDTGIGAGKIDTDDLRRLRVTFPSLAEQQRIADCLGSLDDLIAAEGRKLEALRQHKQGLMQQLFPQPGETVPRLRFPEFRDAPGWQVKELSDLLISISNGCSLPQNNSTSGLKFTRIETIANGTVDLVRVGYVEATEEEVKQYRLNIGDLLFSNINSIAHIGKSVLIEEDYNLYHGMNLLRLQVNQETNSPQFIYFSINTSRVRDSLRARANKAVNQASINQTALGKTLIPSPSRDEQQKIADCLGSLDDLIVAEEQKLEALRQHKQGLMQQLFPSLEGSE